MWHNNKSVVRTHSKNGAKLAWAIVDGVASNGWVRIGPSSADGVTNLLMLLSMARANGRNVDVFLDGTNQITQATLR